MPRLEHQDDAEPVVSLVDEPKFPEHGMVIDVEACHSDLVNTGPAQRSHCRDDQLLQRFTRRHISDELEKLSVRAAEMPCSR